MTLKTSLIITGDSSAGVAAVNALTDAVNKMGTTAQSTAAPAAELDKSVGSAGTTARDTAGAMGALDGAISDVAASASGAAGDAAALEGAIGGIGGSARDAANDAGFLDGALDGVVSKIGDMASKAIGLDGALSTASGSTKEASQLAGELEGKLGEMAQGALSSAAAQGAIARASGVAATAMGGFGVSAATVEAILTGGLSLALTAVIGFLSGFAAEALSGSDALGQEEDAAKSLTEQINELNKALERETKTQYTARVETLNHAEAKRVLAIRTIEARKALLETATTEAEQRRGNVKITARGDVVDPGFAAAAAEVERLKAQVKEAEGALAAANKAVNSSRQYFVDRGIATATDPRARAILTYDQGLDRLDRSRTQMGETAYAREKIALDKEKAAALDALTASESKASKSGRDLASTRKAGSAADREAAEASKKLQADLDSVTGRFDPARKAASDYADELVRIGKLEGAKKISGDQAADYRAQASAAYLSKALPIGDLKDMAAQEQAAINASGAIDKIVQSIQDETTALRTLDPVQRAMLGYRQQLLDMSPEERAAAEARIAGALREREATDAVKQATQDAQRAKEQLARTAVDAFAAIVAGGQKAEDVIGRLAESIASAAIEATIFGTGPMAALLGGAVAPAAQQGGAGQSAANDLAAKTLAKTVGDKLETSMDKVFGAKGSFGTTLKNAGLGYAAGGMTGSRTGGAVGGAIGGYVGKELLGSALGSLGQFAGPIGAIAGGLLGGVVGGLLKKTKTGAANITSVDSDAVLSGNSSSFKQAAAGAAGSVQGGLSDIAEALGGSIGGFNVTIGQRHGDWRVRSGSGSLKVAKGAKEFDDDQEGAIAYAMQLAISQGAVIGLSTAVQKALQGDTNLEAALTEALKVQEVETLLGGVGSAMASQFKALETQAKERVRIATQYGFDVVAIEKKNAEDRVKLVDQLLAERVGSLQSLLDDMNFGGLAEGSIADQRTALLAEIVKARGAAEAGEDGAADKLATLSRQLIELSREGYGTAGGEYTSDRNTATEAAQAVIMAEKDRIASASAEQAVTNQKLDEANDIATDQVETLAEISTKLSNLIQAVTSSGSGIALDTSLVARGL